MVVRSCDRIVYGDEIGEFYEGQFVAGGSQEGLVGSFHHETSGSAACMWSTVTVLARPRAAAINAWWQRLLILRARPCVAWKTASVAACSKRGSSVPARRRRGATEGGNSSRRGA